MSGRAGDAPCLRSRRHRRLTPASGSGGGQPAPIPAHAGDRIAGRPGRFVYYYQFPAFDVTKNRATVIRSWHPSFRRGIHWMSKTSAQRTLDNAAPGATSSRLEETPHERWALNRQHQSFRGALRSASRNPSGIRSLPCSARRMKPSRARLDKRFQDESRKSEIERRGTQIGLSLAVTPTRPAPTHQAASGNRRPPLSENCSKSWISPGLRIRPATQAATGTDTAFPIMLQRAPRFNGFLILCRRPAGFKAL